jgi:hypothetical protein
VSALTNAAERRLIASARQAALDKTEPSALQFET